MAHLLRMRACWNSGYLGCTWAALGVTGSHIYLTLPSPSLEQQRVEARRGC